MSWSFAGNGIQGLLYRIAGDRYRELVSFALSWKSIVGSLLAERSFIIKYERGVLFIGVTNSTWLQELYLHKEEIIKKAYRATGIQLHDIIFTIRNKVRV